VKILYLTNLPAPYRVLFFSELGKLCELTVLYERHSASDRNTKWTVDGEKTFEEIYLNGREIGTDNSFTLEAISHIKLHKYDFIVIEMYSTYTAMATILYMKSKNIPFIISTDGGLIKDESKLKYALKHYLISSADYWLSTGKQATDYLEFYGANKNRCYIYPFSSVKTEEIVTKPLSSAKKLKYRTLLGIEEKKVVISVGQFIYRKGYDVLLKAAKELNHNIGFYIIGGQALEEYEAFKRNNGLEQVHFVDFLQKDKLDSYYKAADLFVLPTREDIWGLVVNEAMAYGLPVITTSKCGAGVEIISNDRFGRIIDNPEDYLELANAINDILQNSQFVPELVLEKAKEYSIENMAKRTFSILNELVGAGIWYE